MNPEMQENNNDRFKNRLQNKIKEKDKWYYYIGSIMPKILLFILITFIYLTYTVSYLYPLITRDEGEQSKMNIQSNEDKLQQQQEQLMNNRFHKTLIQISNLQKQIQKQNGYNVYGIIISLIIHIFIILFLFSLYSIFNSTPQSITKEWLKEVQQYIDSKFNQESIFMRKSQQNKSISSNQSSFHSNKADMIEDEFSIQEEEQHDQGIFSDDDEDEQHNDEKHEQNNNNNIQSEQEQQIKKIKNYYNTFYTHPTYSYSITQADQQNNHLNQSCPQFLFDHTLTQNNNNIDDHNDDMNSDENKQLLMKTNANSSQNNHNNSSYSIGYNNDNNQNNISSISAIKHNNNNNYVGNNNINDDVMMIQKADSIYSQNERQQLEEIRIFNQIIQDLESKGIRFCKKCQNFKPPRTHHCRQCRKCILKMDHHCQWLNTCIGQSNYKYFLLIILYSNIILTIMSFTYTSRYVEQLEDKNGDLFMDFVVSFYFYLTLVLTCLLLGFGLYHFRILSSNITTIEWCEKKNDAGKYNKGFKQNFKDAFGDNLWSWFLPTQPVYYTTKQSSTNLKSQQSLQ